MICLWQSLTLPFVDLRRSNLRPVNQISLIWNDRYYINLTRYLPPAWAERCLDRPNIRLLCSEKTAQTLTKFPQ